jgi:hypothetical protein
MIQITDTLTSPLGEVFPNTEIRITALNNNESVLGVYGSTFTDGSGDYDFNLVQGQHRIELLQEDEYIVLGDVEVTVDTPTPLTLTELLTTYAIPVV